MHAKERVSDKFSELFHYTTVDGFIGIYKTGCLWATHWGNLNDRSELRRFELVIIDSILPRIRKKFKNRMHRESEFSKAVDQNGGVEAIIHEDAIKHLQTLHRVTFGERGLPGPFICCFCAHTAEYQLNNGLLSQWRGYGAGGGIAIVFDTKALERKMRREKKLFSDPINHIGDVKYDDDIAGIKREFKRLFDRLPELLDDFYADRQPNYETIWAPYIHGSTLVKHHSFHEEKEVRIVVSPNPTESASIFYGKTKPCREIWLRPKGEGEARFIELFSEQKTQPLPIKRVIVGPSRIQNLNYQHVTDLLRDSNIEVTKSETPFVG